MLRRQKELQSAKKLGSYYLQLVQQGYFPLGVVCFLLHCGAIPHRLDGQW